MSLDVDGENTTGAVRLYERVGMHVDRRHGHLRAPAVSEPVLRAPRPGDAAPIAALVNEHAVALGGPPGHDARR